jgi:hypothetical protein
MSHREIKDELLIALRNRVDPDDKRVYALPAGVIKRWPYFRSLSNIEKLGLNSKPVILPSRRPRLATIKSGSPTAAMTIGIVLVGFWQRPITVGRCLSWVIRDPVEPAAGPARSAMPRKRKQTGGSCSSELQFARLPLFPAIHETTGWSLT